MKIMLFMFILFSILNSCLSTHRDVRKGVTDLEPLEYYECTVEVINNKRTRFMSIFVDADKMIEDADAIKRSLLSSALHAPHRSFLTRTSTNRFRLNVAENYFDSVFRVNSESTVLMKNRSDPILPTMIDLVANRWMTRHNFGYIEILLDKYFSPELGYRERIRLIPRSKPKVLCYEDLLDLGNAVADFAGAIVYKTERELMSGITELVPEVTEHNRSLLKLVLAHYLDKDKFWNFLQVAEQ